MTTSTVLSITGYRGEPVANRLLQPEERTERLALLLPGFGYTLDMPLFYYAEHLLQDRGWDVLRVEYAYSQRPDFGTLPRQEQRRWLLADAEAAFRAALANGSYGQIALVGKSLGTAAMGHLLALPDVPTSSARAVWLTPLFGERALRDQITRFGGSSLVVIGAADPHYDPALLAELTAATNCNAVVIDNADHGMDIPGDPVASARALVQIVDAMSQFIGPG